ncbi:MAG: ribokinase [Segetibacter sp.]|nr:ribokinase [Segetibacter sp.]
MSKKIVVIGSSNTDMVIKAERFPLPGETLLGGTFFMNPGGKGANQAVAAARLGGEVVFIARVGTDIFGSQALQQFNSEGINTQYIVEDPNNPSGVALITVDAKGENTIVVASGANNALSISDINNAEAAINDADILLIQLEIPIEVVEQVTGIGKTKNLKVILNPAPAMPLNEKVFRGLYLITPNETEAEILTGISITDNPGIEEAAKILKAKGVQNVIITLGKEGAYVLTDTINSYVPAPKVVSIDSTAAGDVFSGALAVSISEGKELMDAVVFASKAAAISVTKLGAQASAPLREEVEKMVN